MFKNRVLRNIFEPKRKEHIARMEDNAPCKKITFSQPEGSRKKGRSKLRWLDSVLKDFKILTVTA
jgi:hypothetical protein